MSHHFGIFVVVFCAAVLGTAAIQIWQNRPLTCYKCWNEECRKTVEKTETCKLNTDRCMTVFKADKTVGYRGCESDMTEEFAKICKSNGTCFDCLSNKCNIATATEDYIDCISCDSFDNPRCLTDAKSTGLTRKCHKHCMVALFKESQVPNANYHLIRTCLDDKEEKDRKECMDGSSKCKSCPSNKCNDLILPENRLKCFNCQGQDCQNENLKPQFCPVYNEKDRCSYKLSSNNAIESSQCLSSLTDAVASDWMLKNLLIVCSGDACNSVANLNKPQNCVKCNSMTDPLCSTNPTKLPANATAVCSQIPYTNCYVQVQGGITTRGCITDLEKLDRLQCDLQKNSNCNSCTGANCNKQVFPSNRRKCFRCTSESDKDCEKQPKGETLSVCPTYVEGDSCVVHFTDKKITRRDCSSELPCDGMDGKKCRICSNDGCNIADLKKANSAMGMYLALGAMLAMASHLIM